ncbi:MAG: hydrolase [Hyphomonadaceae bacterium]|nr:hydrolase [Hyphomonadaceae bacterium]
MSADNLEAKARAAWGADIEPLLERLDGEGEGLVARAESWSTINSGSFELPGLAAMRVTLLDTVSELPAPPEVVDLQPSQRVRPDGEVIDVQHGASIRVRVRPDAPIQVALTGHYDTVFPASHPFQAPWREGEMLRGPGVADMKGGIAVMLAALKAFERLPGEKRIGYEVLLSPDEEIGSMGSAPLLAELGKRAHLGLTYEPAMADGALVDQRKGSANFHLAVRGRAAHVGRAFSDGRNAVLAAADAAMSLNRLNGQRDGVTFNIGAIDGGGAVNVVPERAVLRFNIRVPDAESAIWAEAEVRRIARETGERDGIDAHLHGGFTRPPKPLNDQQRTMVAWTRQAGSALGLDLQFRPSGGVCEGNNLAAAGCPNIDTLGPCGGGLHSDEEFAVISSFAERAKLSFLLLAGVERGVFDVRSLRS